MLNAFYADRYGTNLDSAYIADRVARIYYYWIGYP